MSVDPLELFDSLQPAPGWDEPTDLETDAVAAEILDRVFAGDVVDLDAARRRRRRRIGGGLVVAAVVAGGAVAALIGRSPDEARTVSCWSEAAAPPDALSQLVWDGATDPAELCAEEWAAGRFGDTTPPDDLQTCVGDDLAAAVMPGDDEVCERVGLVTFSGSVDPGVIAVAMAARDLDERFNNDTCRPTAEAVTATEEVFQVHGLNGWAITIAGETNADEPCATVALDPEVTTAFVIAIPRSP